MIKLHGFTRAFGLPDPSPFVMKVETLLRMLGLPYEFQKADPRRAPKGKLPFIDDGGTIVADSTLIRQHLERRAGRDLDQSLTPEQRATAWALERMCEEHLYWAIVHDRWVVDRNFNAGPAHFFKSLPAVIRPAIIALIRRKVRGSLHAQGMGRHAETEIHALAIRDVEAISSILGDKPFLMGTEPCGADACVHAFIASVLLPVFVSPVRDAAEQRANLIAYRDRGMARWYGDLARS